MFNVQTTKMRKLQLLVILRTLYRYSVLPLYCFYLLHLSFMSSPRLFRELRKNATSNVLQVCQYYRSKLTHLSGISLSHYLGSVYISKSYCYHVNRANRRIRYTRNKEIISMSLMSQVIGRRFYKTRFVNLNTKFISLNSNSFVQ